MRKRWLGLAVLLWLGTIGAASAAGYDDFVKGQKALLDFDFPAAIDLLGKAVADDGLAPSYRIIAYTDRADAYRYSGKCDLGLADADKALALAPADPSVNVSRAMIQVCLGQYTPALQSLDAAIAATPFAGLLEARSRLLLQMGRGPEALADAERAIQDPLDPYALLLVATVRQRLGKPDASEIAVGLRRLLRHDWPVPLVALYQGTATEADVWRAAADGNPRAAADQKCEADYFIGEWRLAHGDEAGARSLFQAAVDTCLKFSNEALDAPVELRQLH